MVVAVTGFVMSSSTTPSSAAVTRKLIVGNLGTNITEEDLRSFFGLNRDDHVKAVSGIELSTTPKGNIALVHIPVEIFDEIRLMHGQELSGRIICIKDPEAAQPALTTLANVASWSLDDARSPANGQQDTPMDFGDFQTGGPPKDGSQQGTPSYSNVADSGVVRQPVVYKYVELDTTTCFDCYGVPSRAMVMHALGLEFGWDRTKNVKQLFGQNSGIWRIETENIDEYQNFAGFLSYNDQRIGSITVKTEEQSTDSAGKVFTKNIKPKNELLLTLVGANLNSFRDVTNAAILREIVMMDAGEVKRAPTPQVHYGTDILNGNKFCVLEHITPDQYQKIPNFFDFGGRRMYINFRGKKRYCKFCSESHAGTCELEETYQKLLQEREEMKSQNPLPYMTYGPSTVKYFRQEALASDVHAMSGATMGNLLNAHEINGDAAGVENIVLVASCNGLNERFATEEFIRILETEAERLTSLAADRNVAILAPPKPVSPSSAHKFKVAKYWELLQDLNDNVDKITVWENPVNEYAEDDGKHPSPDQSKEIVNFLDRVLMERYGRPYKLPSATDEILTVSRGYSGVRSLYKYGCGACNTVTEDKNKIYSVCAKCKEVMALQPFQQKVSTFNRALTQLEETENPSLPRKRLLDGGINEDENKRNRRSSVFKK